MPTLLTVLLIMAALLQGAAPAIAQDPGRLPVRPTLTIANPRTGFVSVTTASADNFLIGAGRTSADPLASVKAGHRFRLRSAYEAAFFPRGAGWASYDLYVYSVREDSGRGELLGEDHAREAGLGPQRKAGDLHVDLGFEHPGAYPLLIKSRTTAAALAGPGPVVDEDEIIVVIVVLPTDASATSDGDRPIPVALGGFSVGTPRTAVITNPQVGVENFAQGHGATIKVRAGTTVTFTTSYDLVWYETATATSTAVSSLEMFHLTSVATPTRLAGDQVREQARGPHRAAGQLQVPVPFREPGVFRLMARLETAVLMPTSADVVGNKDVDEVRLVVIVEGHPQQGDIAGEVWAADTGLPLAGVWMEAFDADTGQPAGQARTGDGGGYTIRGLRPGAYLVRADPRHHNYLPEWYDDVFKKEHATPVPVQAGQTSGDINFGLSPGGKLSGRVTLEPDGSPLGGARIQVGDFVTGRVIASGRALDDGTYLIERLPSGRFWVHADAPHKEVIGEFHHDKPTMDEADPVLIQAGTETTGIDFALALGGSISGRVGGEVGPLLPAIEWLLGIKVDALRWENNRPIGRAETGPEGYYRIRGLPVGTYRAYAYDERGRYVPEYYDDVTDPEEATPVPVVAGENTPEVNFILSKVLRPVVSVVPRVTQIRGAVAPLRGNQPVTVTVAVAEVRDLGSFAFDLAYDPGLVHVQAVHPGEFLGSTSREVTAGEPVIDNEHGRVHFEATTAGGQPGPSGRGALAQVVLLGQAEGASRLALENVSLFTTQGDELTPITQDGRVLVGGCILGDVNCDCRVDIVDARLVASRWGAEEGDPDYDPRYDLDDDGDIDLADLFIVLENWGRTCDRTADQANALGAETLALLGGPDGSPLYSGAWLEVPTGSLRQGQWVTARLMIADAIDLSGVEFRIAFDPTVLQPVNARLGSLLGEPETTVPLPLRVEGGTLAFGGVMLGAGPGAQGAGSLAEVTFQVVGPGRTDLLLTEVRTADSFAQAQEGIATRGATVEAGRGMVVYLPLIVRKEP